MSEREPLLPPPPRAEDNPDLHIDASDIEAQARTPGTPAYSARVADALETRAAHIFILTLVCIDIAIVIADLAWTLLHPRCVGPGEPEPSDPTWLRVLSSLSTVITVAFLLEVPTEIFAFGWGFYSPYQRPLQFFDATILIVTAVFELVRFIRSPRPYSVHRLTTLGRFSPDQLKKLLALSSCFVSGVSFGLLEVGCAAPCICLFSASLPGFTGVAMGVNELKEHEINELQHELAGAKKELAQVKLELQELRARTNTLPSDEL